MSRLPHQPDEAPGPGVDAEVSTRPRWLSARFNAAAEAGRAIAGRTILGRSWQQVPGDEALAVRELLNSAAAATVPAITVCMRKRLPFYPDHVLYKFLRLGITSGLREEHVVADGSRVFRLDRAGSAIGDLNASVRLLLDGNTLLDYLHFFFAFSRDRRGRRFLVESVDDLRFSEAPDRTTREALTGLIPPVKISSSSAKGAAFEADCTFLLGRKLIACTVFIGSHGEIRFGEERLLRSDLEATAVDHVS